MSGVSKVGDDSTLPDPEVLLMEVAIDTQEKELGIQNGFSSYLATESAAATFSMNTCQTILTNYANTMVTATDQSTMATENAIYNEMQTVVSDMNNKSSNIMQALGTVVTDLTQVESQSLQLCQIVVDFLNAITQYISAWPKN